MQQEATTFADMAQIAGLPVKGMYNVREVATASGVAYTTLCEEARTGHLRTFLPRGRSRGRLIKPMWFDEWYAEGDTPPPSLN